MVSSHASRTLVEILGEVDMKVKSVRGQVEYIALVVAGGQGILVLSEKVEKPADA